MNVAGKPPRTIGRKIAVLLGQFLAVIIALTALALAVGYPIHRDYYRRVDVSEAVAYGKIVASAVSAYRTATGSIPNTVQSLEPLPDRPPQVREIKVEEQSGTVVIRVANMPQGEDQLEFRSAPGPAGALGYSCISKNIPDAFVPSNCSIVNTN